jgi:beta-glucanase (GH16 family)
MKLTLWCFVFIISVVFSCSKKENSVTEDLPDLPGTGWKMKWNDEFNSTSLDLSKGWSVPDSSPWHNPNNLSFIRFSDGHLILHAEGVQCAYIQTINKTSFQYGYMEARCRMSTSLNQQSAWPCFWMCGWPDKWLPEYDIAEFGAWDGFPYPSQVNQGIHSDPAGGQTDNCNGVTYPSNALRSEWHTYGVLIQEGQKPVFYFDNKPSWTAPCIDNRPTFLILHNVQSGHGLSPLPDFQVDWVRWYEKV